MDGQTDGRTECDAICDAIYFEYDKVKNKSKCIVTKAERDDNGEPMTCGKELVGKFTTNLKKHNEKST